MKTLIFIISIVATIIAISYVSGTESHIKDTVLMLFKPNAFTDESVKNSLAIDLKGNPAHKKAFESDEKYRAKKISSYKAKNEPRTQKLRANIFKSAYIVVCILLFSFIFAFIMKKWFPVSQNFITIIQIISVLLILWGLLGKLGWTLQTFSGVTLQEQINNYWFRILNGLGAYLLLFSYFHNCFDASKSSWNFSINSKLLANIARVGTLLSLRKIVNSRIFYIPFFIALLVMTYLMFISKTSDAFQGAFFGFLVGIIAFIYSKNHELQARRYNVLIYLEHEINACFNDLGDNKFQIKKALETDKLTMISPVELKLTEEHVKHLGRVELKNDIFPLFIDINKYNHSFKQTIEMFERNVSALRDFGLKKGTDEVNMEEVINAYYQQFKEGLKTMWETGERLDESLKDCMVKIRFFAKNDQPMLSKEWFMAYYNKKEYEKWVREDRGRLNQEMIDSTKRDEEERARIKQKLKEEQ